MMFRCKVDGEIAFRWGTVALLIPSQSKSGHRRIRTGHPSIRAVLLSPIHVPPPSVRNHRARPGTGLVRGDVPRALRWPVRVRVRIRTLARDRARAGTGSVLAVVGAPGHTDRAAAHEILPLYRSPEPSPPPSPASSGRGSMGSAGGWRGRGSRAGRRRGPALRRGRGGGGASHRKPPGALPTRLHT